MRLFNNRNERLSTAVFLQDGSVYQVFPSKQVVESRDAWVALHPSWTELREGQKTLFNTTTDAETGTEFMTRRSLILGKMRQGARPIKFATRWSSKLHPINGHFYGYSVEELMEIHLKKCDEEGTHWFAANEGMARFVWNLNTQTAEQVIAQLSQMIRWDLRILKRNEYFRANLNLLHAHFLALHENNSYDPQFTKSVCSKALYYINRMKKAPIH